MLALIFPAEVSAHPDIGPALVAGRLLHAAFEHVPGSVGIGGCRFGLAEQFAEVEEVLLAGAALG